MNVDAIRFEVAAVNGDCKRLVVAWLQGEEVHRSKVDCNSADSRRKFLKQLAEKTDSEPAAMVKNYDQRLIHLADQADAKADADANSPDLSAGGDDDPQRKSQATMLVELVLASKTLLFHDAEGNAFARYQVENHFEVARIGSGVFKRWLARLYYEKTGKAPNSQAKTDAAGVLEGKALFDGPEHTVYVRLAGLEDRICLDLCNKDWEVVEIDEKGWRVLRESPVMFRRAKAMLPLPHPVAGGSIGQLRRFIVTSGASFVLIVGWLIAALRPRGPYPVLEFDGEQGCGKSTTAKMLRDLIDPNTADLRSEPKDPRDLMIAANNGHIVALDNLSYMPDWLSDCLCRLATGGGFSTRMLYENDEEMVFNSSRPALLNGIEQVPSRGDLLDRSMLVSLEPISEEARLPETQLWQAYHEARPAILGALLTAVSAAIRNLPTTRVPKLPRMADFALWVTAAETALGWKQGTFLSTYAGNREEADNLAIDSSIVGKTLLELLDGTDGWEDTATSLLQELERRAGLKDVQRKPKGWPGNARALSGAIKRIAPHLRKIGWEYKPGRDTRSRRRLITIRKVAGICVPSDRCDREDGIPGETHDSGGTQTDNADAVRTQTTAETDGEGTQAKATNATNAKSPSISAEGSEEVGGL